MKKGYVKLIVVLLIVIESITLFLAYKSLNNPVDKQEYKYENNNIFAILIEQDDGSYKESSSWPTGEFIYNDSLSGCVDYSGNALNGALSFNEETKVATVNTKTSTKCYLYFNVIPKAYALYFESDKSLHFIRTRANMSAGSTYDGKEVTLAFTGFEETSFNLASDVPWNPSSDNMSIMGYTISSVSFDDKISPIDTQWWFSNTNLETLDVTNLDTSKVTNMSGMFFGATLNSSTIGLDKLDTSNVRNMAGMFSGAIFNTIVNLSGWDVSNVTNMSNMFSGVSANFKRLYIENWDTSRVTNMSYMFSNATIQKEDVNLIDWDVSNVTSHDSFSENTSGDGTITPPLFGKAYALYTDSYGHNRLVFKRSDYEIKVGDKIEEISGAGFEYIVTEVFTDFENVNYNFENHPPWFELTYETGDLALLTTVDYEHLVSEIQAVWFIDTIRPISTATWFLGIGGDEEEIGIDLEKLNTSKVTNMEYMFTSVGWNATKVTILNLDKLDVSNVTNMSMMFANIGARANNLYISGMDNWNVSNVTDMSYMFRSAGSIAITWNIGDISNWNTSNVTNMSMMFANAGVNATYTLDLSGWDVSKVTYSDYFNRNVESKVIMPAFK